MRSSSWLRPALLLFLLAGTSHSAVIERDWQTPGDGLLTYDTVNQREWLDVPLTRISTFPGGYPGVVAATEVGGMFEGFTIAKSDDVIALAEAAGIDPGTYELATNEAPVILLTNLLGSTVVPSDTLGFVDEVNVAPGLPGRLITAIGTNGTQAGVNHFTESSAFFDPGSLDPFTGVWLYRQIPEPHCSALFLSVILSTTGVCRTR